MPRGNGAPAPARESDRAVLPPGTILQHLYLKERLRAVPPGRFIEIGVGDGRLSRLLLAAGWEGEGFDLNGAAVARTEALNRAAIIGGRYGVAVADWFTATPRPADLVIACMVLEHFDAADESRFLAKAHASVVPGGRLILLVPGSPAHWGIDDEIAGHHRRYDRAALSQAVSAAGWRPEHLAGLTYPLSNWLNPLSEFLVRRAERHLVARSMIERTRLSGNRDVPFKTRFPPLLGLLLNEATLTPFHLLQRVFRNHEGAMVLYAEARR